MNDKHMNRALVHTISQPPKHLQEIDADGNSTTSVDPLVKL